MRVTVRMTPVIFHATLVDQLWPKCSQPSSVPNAAVTLPAPRWKCLHVASAQQRPHGAAAKCSVTSFRLLPLMLRVNGQRKTGVWPSTKQKRGEGRKKKKPKPEKTSSLCHHYAKSRMENGSHNQGGQETSWQAMGQLQITAISRQLGQEELVFVLVVWLHIPEAWLSFSLGIMTRWSSSNMCMIFLVFLARKNKPWRSVRGCRILCLVLLLVV